MRYDYIDIAKGLGILAVVWAHIMLVGWSHQIIYAFHMPLFFFVSGMLFNRGKYASFGEFLKKRFVRLIVPYLIYSVLTWGVWALFRYIRGDEVGSYFMPLLQTFIAQGSGAYMVHNSALWFIPCLFAVEIVYYFASRGKSWITAVVCCALAGVSILLSYMFKDEYLFLLPWNFDAALLALPFYCAGNMLTRYVTHQRIVEGVRNKRLFSALALVSLTAVLWWSSRSFGECSMGSSSYNCCFTLFYLRAFVGIAAMLLFSVFVSEISDHCRLCRPGVSYLKWMGRTSLDTMCLHIPAKGVVMIAVAYLFKTTVEGVSENFFQAALAFVITVIGVSGAVLLIDIIFRKKKSLGK